MDLASTIMLLLAAALIAGLANWRERRPRALGDVPLLPYPAIQMLALALAILLLAHLISLVTGLPLGGRSGRPTF